MTVLFAIIIAIAFFVQSILGFGGGLIAIPILSLFMPIQDVVTAMILYQFSMGLLICKTYKQISWPHVKSVIPTLILGVIIGIAILKYIHEDTLRLILASYIMLYLLRTHTSFDPLKMIMEKGGATFAGVLGGILNSALGSGAPPMILYLKDKVKNPSQFRASIIALLFFSNIPRAIGSWSIGLGNYDILKMGLIAYPGFVLAMWLGQRLHDKVPQKTFFLAVECVLALVASALILKVAM